MQREYELTDDLEGQKEAILFEAECEQIANELGVEIIDVYLDGKGDTIVEDDGILHVTKGKVRVAFDVSDNQTAKAKLTNSRIKFIRSAIAGAN